MKLLWCWRCKAEVPMLNDEEFAQVISKQNFNEHTPKATNASRHFGRPMPMRFGTINSRFMARHAKPAANP